MSRVKKYMKTKKSKTKMFIEGKENGKIIRRASMIYPLYY